MKLFKFFSIFSVIVLALSVGVVTYSYSKTNADSPTAEEMIEQVFVDWEAPKSYLIRSFDTVPNLYEENAPSFMKAEEQNANAFFQEIINQPYTLTNEITDAQGITYADMVFDNTRVVTGGESEYETVVNGTIKIYKDVLGQIFPMQINLKIDIRQHQELKQTFNFSANVKSTESGLVYEVNQQGAELEWTDEVTEDLTVSEEGTIYYELLDIGGAVFSITVIVILINSFLFTISSLHSTKDNRMTKVVLLLVMSLSFVVINLCVGMLVGTVSLFVHKNIKEGTGMLIYTVAVTIIVIFASAVPIIF